MVGSHSVARERAHPVNADVVWDCTKSSRSPAVWGRSPGQFSHASLWNWRRDLTSLQVLHARSCVIVFGVQAAPIEAASEARVEAAAAILAVCDWNSPPGAGTAG